METSPSPRARGEGWGEWHFYDSKPLILSFSPLILRDGLRPPQDDGEKERSQCVST